MNAVLAVLTGCLPLQAAEQLPVLRASSPIVDILDGHNLRKGYWTVDPAAKLDVYYAQRSTRPRRVTFRTDIDALSFDVQPGQSYDFLVSLDGKECPTRISTLRESCRRSGAGEIPMHLGRDGKLHIQGRINDSDELDLLFDVGADTLVLYPSARSKKARLALDGTVMNSGMGGIQERATSNENRLRIGDLAWDHEQVMSIETQSDDADGIVGFNVFEDKVVEFDYGRALLTVHDALPAAHDGFTRAELHFEGALPHVEASVSDGKSSLHGWFAFDTGYNGSVYLAREFGTRENFQDGLVHLAANRSRGVGKDTIEGAFVLLPELTLGASEDRKSVV